MVIDQFSIGPIRKVRNIRTIEASEKFLLKTGLNPERNQFGVHIVKSTNFRAKVQEKSIKVGNRTLVMGASLSVWPGFLNENCYCRFKAGQISNFWSNEQKRDA